MVLVHSLTPPPELGENSRNPIVRRETSRELGGEYPRSFNVAAFVPALRFGRANKGNNDRRSILDLS